MLTLVSGIVLVALAGGAFVYSLPRRGKSAWFVGSELEGYAVVAMIGGLGMGLILVMAGIADVRT
jgi:hypothetical protein